MEGKPTLTDLGNTMDAWSNQSGKFADDWLKDLAIGNTREAYWATLERGERERLQDEFAAWAGSAIAAGSRGASETLVSAALSIAGPPPSEGYRQFIAGDFLQGQKAYLDKAPTEKEQQKEKEQHEARLRALLSVFQGPAGEYRMLHGQMNAPLFSRINRMAMWKKEPDNRILLTHKYQLFVYPVGAGPREAPKYRYGVRLVVESDPGPVSADRKPDWKIASLELLEGADVTPSQQMGRPPGEGDGGARPDFPQN
jgi:hypothetical protein